MSIPSKLNEFFRDHQKMALGFSGGVDSSYLLYAAKACGADIRPYFVKSQFQPAFELEDAQRLAKELDIELTILSLDVRANQEVLENTADRCYRCKKVIFGTLLEKARSDGYTILMDGNNASDDATDRPGMRAVEELKVLSPLRLAGLTKQDVRDLSRQAGLFTWDKPSYACLATRIPTDTIIDVAVLERVEQAEAVLADMGYRDYRVRVMGTTAKLQLPEDQLSRAFADRLIIRARLAPYFQDVVLDLKAR